MKLIARLNCSAMTLSQVQIPNLVPLDPGVGLVRPNGRGIMPHHNHFPRRPPQVGLEGLRFRSGVDPIPLFRPRDLEHIEMNLIA